MKLQIMSDLHLECHRDGGGGFLEALDPSGVDVLVLAGDICSVHQLHTVIQELSRKYPNVVYVPGNHEYYGTSPDGLRLFFKLAREEFPNVHIACRPRAFHILGQKFVCGTMWFRGSPATEMYRGLLNDFRHIQDFEPWVYEQNAAFQRIVGATDSDSVVVTHHLPAPESLDPRFASHPTNAFFLCDVSDVIRERQPKLWVHGHTHSQVDARIGATRIVANPHGYPGEVESSHAFQDRLILDV